MEYEGKSGLDSVTALIVRNVRLDRRNDYEEWVRGINQVVKRFEGYMGTDLIRPRDLSSTEYVIVLRFDTYEHLRTWLGSPEREDWVRKAEAMTIGEVHWQEANGLDSWFTLPGSPAALSSPPRYKMVLLTILAIYPSLLVLSTLLPYLFHGWPKPLLMLLSVALLVTAMTYTIMPGMTRLFRTWLYPNSSPVSRR